MKVLSPPNGPKATISWYPSWGQIKIMPTISDEISLKHCSWTIDFNLFSSFFSRKKLALPSAQVSWEGSCSSPTWPRADGSLTPSYQVQICPKPGPTNRRLWTSWFLPTFFMAVKCIRTYIYIYIHIYNMVQRRPAPPNGDGCSVLLLIVPPRGPWWWGVWDVGDGWYVCM